MESVLWWLGGNWKGCCAVEDVEEHNMDPPAVKAHPVLSNPDAEEINMWPVVDGIKDSPPVAYDLPQPTVMGLQQWERTESCGSTALSDTSARTTENPTRVPSKTPNIMPCIMHSALVASKNPSLPHVFEIGTLKVGHKPIRCFPKGESTEEYSSCELICGTSMMSSARVTAECEREDPTSCIALDQPLPPSECEREDSTSCIAFDQPLPPSECEREDSTSCIALDQLLPPCQGLAEQTQSPQLMPLQSRRHAATFIYAELSFLKACVLAWRRGSKQSRSHVLVRVAFERAMRRETDAIISIYLHSWEHVVASGRGSPLEACAAAPPAAMQKKRKRNVSRSPVSCPQIQPQTDQQLGADTMQQGPSVYIEFGGGGSLSSSSSAPSRASQTEDQRDVRIADASSIACGTGQHDGESNNVVYDEREMERLHRDRSKHCINWAMSGEDTSLKLERRVSDPVLDGVGNFAAEAATPASSSSSRCRQDELPPPVPSTTPASAKREARTVAEHLRDINAQAERAAVKLERWWRRVLIARAVLFQHLVVELMELRTEAALEVQRAWRHHSHHKQQQLRHANRKRGSRRHQVDDSDFLRLD